MPEANEVHAYIWKSARGWQWSVSTVEGEFYGQAYTPDGRRLTEPQMAEELHQAIGQLAREGYIPSLF